MLKLLKKRVTFQPVKIHLIFPASIKLSKVIFSLNMFFINLWITKQIVLYSYQQLSIY